MDNYFNDLENIPVVNGEKDYESIENLDLELFSYQIERLLSGNSVNIPEYNLQRLDISIKSEVFEFNPYNYNGSLNQEVLFLPIDLGNTKTYAWLYNTSKNILLYLSSNISQETKEEFL